jgi:hypothetical protein
MAREHHPTARPSVASEPRKGAGYGRNLGMFRRDTCKNTWKAHHQNERELFHFDDPDGSKPGSHPWHRADSLAGEMTENAMGMATMPMTCTTTEGWTQTEGTFHGTGNS